MAVELVEEAGLDRDGSAGVECLLSWLVAGIIGVVGTTIEAAPREPTQH